MVILKHKVEVKMKTDYNIMIIHMKEWILHSKNRSLKYLLNHYEEAEILRDAYIAALKAKAKSAHQIREYYDGWEGHEAIARQRVSIFMKSFCSNKARIIRGRLKLIKDNAELIIERTHSKPPSNLSLNIFGLKLADEEKILVCWKMDLISTDDAMKSLGCSRQTLYNKWAPLQEALKEII